MRKLLTFLFAALMSVGMYAATEVTITATDFPPGESDEFTKDGVTVRAGVIDGDQGDLKGFVTFTTLLGNFTKIEVNAQSVSISGEGWSGGDESKTWTGNASGVAGTGSIKGNGGGVTLKFTIEEPAPATTTTVTWNNNDITGSGTSFTKDGVTITAGSIDLNLKDFVNDGTFTTTLGNFTKIEVSGVISNASGTGWSGDINNRTWTGNASSVSFEGEFRGDNMGTIQFVFTIEEPATPEPQGQTISGGQDPQNTTYYYSTFFDSQVSYLLPAGVEAYVATISDDALTLTKIAVAGQTIPANNAVIFRATVANFTLTPSTADAVTFSATNSLQGTDIEINAVSDCYVLSDEDGKIGFYEYTGNQLNAHKAYITLPGSGNAPRRMRFIFAEEQNTTALDNAETDNMSVKVIENGQLVIIRNGVRYNALGN